jgi:hypothetical protein
MAPVPKSIPIYNYGKTYLILVVLLIEFIKSCRNIPFAITLNVN